MLLNSSQNAFSLNNYFLSDYQNPILVGPVAVRTPGLV